MDMTGRQRIPADRDTVWKALNDVEVLKACIPGCQELSKTSDTAMAATAVIKVGPVSAKFKDPLRSPSLIPNGYRITGEGQGGVAGFAKGGAVIRLEQDGTDTILHYDVSAQVGGKLSQLGGRLIDVTAKQMSNLFLSVSLKKSKAGMARMDIQQNPSGAPPLHKLQPLDLFKPQRDFASPTFRTAPRPFSSIWMLGGVFF
jgi:carbon monoxide dehydrogenase subunit G